MIDEPKCYDSPFPCPCCGEPLEWYPKQSGACLSGDFIASMEETYWCPVCERNFDTHELPEPKG